MKMMKTSIKSKTGPKSPEMLIERVMKKATEIKAINLLVKISFTQRRVFEK
jgi:hypothetical protein